MPTTKPKRHPVKVNAKRLNTLAQQRTKDAEKRAKLPSVMKRIDRGFSEWLDAKAEALTKQTGIRHTTADVCRLVLARMTNA